MNPDLEKWIDEASKGLEPLAREKITEQITEHYEDAVAGYRSSGLSEVDACSRALGDLGSSVKARSGYKAIFFSYREWSWLTSYNNDILSIFYTVMYIGLLFIDSVTIRASGIGSGMWLFLLLILMVSLRLALIFFNRKYQLLDDIFKSKIFESIDSLYTYIAFFATSLALCLSWNSHKYLNASLPNIASTNSSIFWGLAGSMICNAFCIVILLTNILKYIFRITRRARALSK